ncbi:hypothetical protein BKA56DRAFT_491328 [Ilyonectria sp. MPI-CAGE-AT-0026]|nr:hypothetical protein BKA56DRAFT_491328 [Ilyonectria sp. MPI-CAGE-AT-0026]
MGNDDPPGPRQPLEPLGVLHIPGGTITYEAARKCEDNVIIEHHRGAETHELFNHLWVDRHNAEALAVHHVGLERGTIARIAPQEQWQVGDYHICFIVEVYDMVHDTVHKVLFKCYIPSAFGEDFFPKALEEKMRIDVGSHVWMSEKCTEIRIPFMFGYGLPNGEQFTHVAQLGEHEQDKYKYNRELIPRYSPDALMSPYYPHECGNKLPAGYVVMELVETPGTCNLADVWEQIADDPIHQIKISHSISKLMLTVARQPKNRIGCFIVNNNCVVTLNSRPVMHTTSIFQRKMVSPTRPGDGPFTTTEEFVEKMLQVKDLGLVQQPNGCATEQECRSQMAYRVILRSLKDNFLKHDLDDGLFIPQLADLDFRHLRVDKNLNITCLLDIESLCVLPVETFQEPHWLLGLHVQDAENTYQYSNARRFFMDCFKQQEFLMATETTKFLSGTPHVSLHGCMTDMWHSRGFWFMASIMSPTSMYDQAYNEMLTRFSTLSFREIEEVRASLWGDSRAVLDKMNADREAYLAQVDVIFRRASGDTSPDASEDVRGGTLSDVSEEALSEALSGISMDASE